ncbi:MAG: tRNA uridine-5-carboxymethylaminomethyl(34) synthesis GTPase MnmE, partial [Pseudomonadota bacterium]
RAADVRIFMGPTPGAVQFQDGDLRVSPKCDIDPVEDGLPISGETGEGVEALLSHVSVQLKGRASGSGLAIRDRHRVLLLQAAGSLKEAEAALGTADIALEEVSDHLRRCLVALDTLVGRIGVEAVLGEIFSAFCIGK